MFCLSIQLVTVLFLTVPAVCKDVQQSPDSSLCNPNKSFVFTYNMIRDLINTAILLLFLTGFSVNSIIQTPPHLLPQNNAESVSLHCSHTNPSFNVILWYKQPLSGEMQLMGNLFLVTGATMNITCSHHDKTYDKIFWYQQSNGQNLEHLGFLSFKQDSVDRKGFTITGDAEKEAYLLVSSVKAEHSAVYFCAQSPKHLLRTVEEKEAKLSCHHGDSSYIYLYWYQQKNKGSSLELIGMLTGDSGTPEEKFKPRFVLSGHATKDASLLISSISVEDSAVYFCATICVVCSPVVQQSPKHLLQTMKEKEAKLSCHHGDSSYQYLYWYQQKNEGTLELIGMLTVCVVCSPVIQQSPKHLLQTVEEKKAKLSCHHGDSSYQYLYWYQQKSNACVVCSPVIQQSPKHLLQTVKEKEANLSCHHGDSSYPYLYWYQQKNKGGSLELIGMLSFGAASQEDKFKPRFVLSGHATNDAFLLISSISAEDSAVYFCAASMHSRTDLYKP
ncbi:hypothetical protein G5714_017317 [Onychostoma macrolepis]|uniref:Ig-like domain-containing protein n=1 Tax=Onychostoma macrolepis TaxID=369639 RepID=A0A7J6C5D9_9TELE|nr:hypothetical protein G5714_017317 [Onychostoma macrolepis]